MTTIIVPLDGSSFAAQVLPAATQLAVLMHSNLHLLRVVEGFKQEQMEPGSDGAPDAAPQNTLPNHVFRDVEAYLEEQACDMRAAGITTTVEVCGGSPGTQITARACATSASLIAMMTHGRSGIRRWALGSVADQVIHTAHTPVFVNS